MVLSCTVSKILQFFELMTPPLFHPNFGDVAVGSDRPRWSQAQHSLNLKLTSLEIIFEVFQPM